MSAASGAIDPVEMNADFFDFEAFFRAHYERTACVIARVVGDHSRAEDLAAEALWKLWRTPRAQGEKAGGWLYRTAVRMGLNELRSGRRRLQYESQAWDPPRLPTPEEAHAAAQEREQVRQILAMLRERQAELLILRSRDVYKRQVWHSGSRAYRRWICRAGRRPSIGSPRFCWPSFL